jgi:hypothetical protein
MGEGSDITLGEFGYRRRLYRGGKPKNAEYSMALP